MCSGVVTNLSGESAALIFSEDGESRFLRNVGNHVPDHTVS